MQYINRSSLVDQGKKHKMDDEDDKGGQSVMPVHSRMDRLDSLMKYLEGKQNSSGCGGGNSSQRECLPIDLAVRDIYTKGSILDRVALLENRLFQLCLEIEASSTISSSIAHTSGNASDRQGSTTDQSQSFGSIEEENVTSHHNPNIFHRALVNRFEFLGTSNSMNNKSNSSSGKTKHLISTEDATEDKPVLGKKLKARNRKWKTLLGC